MGLVHRFVGNVHDIGAGIDRILDACGVPFHRPLLIVVQVNDGEMPLVCPLGYVRESHPIIGKTGTGEKEVDSVAHIGFAVKVQGIAQFRLNADIGSHSEGTEKAGQAEYYDQDPAYGG